MEKKILNKIRKTINEDNDDMIKMTHKNTDNPTNPALKKITKQILDQQQQMFSNNNSRSTSDATGYNYTFITTPNTTTFTTTPNTTTFTFPNYPPHYAPMYDDPVELEPSPNIDMELDIYKNEFEESTIVEIGDPSYGVVRAVSIGLIDSVSEKDEDLYAKFPNGEIIPFKGHTEKFTIQLETWNDLKRSDITGNEIRKAAICKILINNILARIIEGTDIQDLLTKTDRAIDELKAQPFSICRDRINLVNREIYYNNQPAIIDYIDEINNFIHIIPDPKYLSHFLPPAYAFEDDEMDEWIENFGHGMLIRDYDEKIWWWRNSTRNIDPSTDPFYKQFPQPVAPSPLAPSPLAPQFGDPNFYYPDGSVMQPNNPFNPNILPGYKQLNPFTINGPITEGAINTGDDIKYLLDEEVGWSSSIFGSSYNDDCIKKVEDI